MLCHVCRSALEGTADPAITPRLKQKDPDVRLVSQVENYVYGHQRTKASLYISVEAHCIICTSIHRAALKALGRALSSEDGDGTSFFTTFEIVRADDELKVTVACGIVTYDAILVPVGTEQYDANLTFELDDNTGGLQAWAIADQWMKSCISDHQRCSAVQDPSFLPSRLLQISVVQNVPTYRLVLRNECPSSARYIALSYVWGKTLIGDKLRLLETTFKDLRRLRPVSTLPKTYADTMTVALRLGIHYLWVDSLCIYQDSKEDWRAEAATMQHVYRNAVLTIAALAGAGDHAGLFHDRDTASVTPTRVKIDHFGDGRLSVYRHTEERGGWWSSWTFGSGSSLTKRAWCYQERLLSPRSLYFGSDHLFWECRERLACEANPISVRWPPYVNPSHWKQLFASPSCPPMASAYVSILQEWYSSIQIYSSTSVTVPSDKLIAISGVAKDTREALKAARPDVSEVYLAGLWEADLLRGLCWSKNEYGKRPSVYRGPSWSWASLDGAASYISGDFMGPYCYWFVDAKACTAWTKTIDDVDTNEVLAGELRLTSPLAVVNISNAHPPGQFSSETSRMISTFGHPVSGVQIDLPTHGRDQLSYMVFDVENEVVGQAFCVPIYIYPSERNSPESTQILRGLVLVKTESGDLFRRVGCLNCLARTRATLCSLFGNFEARTIAIV
jgi:hypothetical protein